MSHQRFSQFTRFGIRIYVRELKIRHGNFYFCKYIKNGQAHNKRGKTSEKPGGGPYGFSFASSLTIFSGAIPSSSVNAQKTINARWKWC